MAVIPTTRPVTITVTDRLIRIAKEMTMANEALSAYRDTLAKDIEKYEDVLGAMKDGQQKTFQVDSSGRQKDITAERIADFERIISSLNAVIRDLDIKLGI